MKLIQAKETAMQMLNAKLTVFDEHPILTKDCPDIEVWTCKIEECNSISDVADLIKDAVVLPWSFIGASQGISEQEFRELILQKFVEYKVLDYMFDSIKEVIEQVAESEDNVL